MARSTQIGIVQVWNRGEGWGVLSSPDVPGAVWAHFGVVETTGFVALEVGERVEFRCRQQDQDGFSYVATFVRRLPG